MIQDPTLTFMARLPLLRLLSPLSSLAQERGIHFELSYSSSLRDASSRRHLFANLLSLLRLTKGRNLVLASAATKEMELRAPWDVINL
jgi:ribonuclease P/MRP protein subunit RPP1